MVATALVATVVAALSGACGVNSHTASAARLPATTRTAPATTAPTSTDPVSTAALPTTVPPTTIPAATSTTVSSLPTFAATVSGPLIPADVPFTWRPGCPVPPSDLREIQLTYFGFDHAAHTGTIIVNAASATDVIDVFRTLYAARFSIRGMVPEDAFHGSDPASMAADNTSGFNCRYAVATGPPTWSMHAFGDAIDVNPVENPYFEPGYSVEPPAGAAYSNRQDIRPGMAYSGGLLLKAFTAIGWGWGGDWDGPDYQHFSTNGR